MFAMATHVFKFFCCFANVSDVCCKCFSYFGRMLQVFHPNVAKVDRMFHMLIGIHLPQPPATAAEAPSSGQPVLTCGRAAWERVAWEMLTNDYCLCYSLFMFT